MNGWTLVDSHRCLPRQSQHGVFTECTCGWTADRFRNSWEAARADWRKHARGAR